MPRMIVPTDAMKRILRQRRRARGDRKDEVWNGVYVMAPDADNEHQGIAVKLAVAILGSIGDDPRAIVQAGGNVSDREEKWAKNYRCPDVLVVLPGNPAEDRGTRWLGGPDFVVEILSPDDRSRKKFAFYAGVGVRELLLIDRSPWRLELYRLHDGVLEPAGVSDTEQPNELRSTVLPLTFRLTPGQPRPRIEMTRPDDGAVWWA